jgi:hypothetical protein
VKVCSKCGVSKPLSRFGKHKKCKDGLHPSCKDCKYLVDKAYREANKERLRKLKSEHYFKNKESIQKKQRAYYEENAERIKAYSRNWGKEYRNREYVRSKHCATQGARRAMKVSATPLWANLGCVGIFYRERDWISDIINTVYHVDHVVPLQGDDVCGLHVETNLRIIPAEENLSKSNKFEENI